jgi:hypothetical protein
MVTDVRAESLDHRGEYGFDGNIVLALGMAAAVASLLVIAVVLFARGEHQILALTTLMAAVALLLTIGFSLHTTRRGKFAVWAELLEALRLSGDERVLDVGCSRGAVLTME